jgi:hypothetical protein
MTGEGERKLKVSVWGKPHEITFYPTSKPFGFRECGSQGLD